jgi:hypothetical protein
VLFQNLQNFPKNDERFDLKDELENLVRVFNEEGIFIFTQ